MTENEYLELTLAQLAKTSKGKAQNTRDSLMKIFQDRELISIHHPLGPISEEVPGALEGIEDPRLCEEFKADVDYLHNKLFKETPAKQIWSRPIKGNTLASLLEEYV